MIKIVKEGLSPRYENFIENQYYIRMSNNPDKFIGSMPHRLVNEEQAVICKSEEEAQAYRRRFANRNKYNTNDFEIISGARLYYDKNSNEEKIFKEETETDEQIDIYRGILADNKKEADKYIKSTKTTGAQDFGKGMYWTQSEEVAKNYGNYIYKATINKSDAKKILDAQDIVLLSKDFHKTLNPVLVDQLDIGYNTQYTFYPKLWKDPEMVKEIQSKCKDYIKRTGGIFID